MRRKEAESPLFVCTLIAISHSFPFSFFPRMQSIKISFLLALRVCSLVWGKERIHFLAEAAAAQNRKPTFSNGPLFPAQKNTLLVVSLTIIMFLSFLFQCHDSPKRECSRVPKENCQQIPTYNCKKVKSAFVALFSFSFPGNYA